MSTLTGLVIARAHAQSVADQVRAMGGGWEREFTRWAAGRTEYLILLAHTQRRATDRDPVAVPVKDAMHLRKELRSLIGHVRQPMHWTLALPRDSDVLHTVLECLPLSSISEVAA